MSSPTIRKVQNVKEQKKKDAVAMDLVVLEREKETSI